MQEAIPAGPREGEGGGRARMDSDGMERGVVGGDSLSCAAVILELEMGGGIHSIFTHQKQSERKTRKN